MDKQQKYSRDNHSNQKNPNNEAYWKSRGYPDRPTEWQGKSSSSSSSSSNKESSKSQKQ